MRITDRAARQCIRKAVAEAGSQLAFLRANGVQPRTAASNGADRRPYEVGEVANASTVFLQCYR